MTVGQKIYQLRTSRKLSQEQLAFDLNVARQTISKWETDAVLPTTDNIQALCKYFNVESSFLLDTHLEDFNKNIVTSIEDIGKTEIAVTSEIIKTKKYPNALILFLVILLSSIFVFSLIIGIICTTIITQPQEGIAIVQYSRFDWVLIVFFGLAIVSLISLMIVIFLIVRKRKKRKSSESDKL